MQRLAVIVGTFAVLVGGAIRANAQAPIPITSVDSMEFDRPESWALKYFSSTTLFTGLEMPTRTTFGEVRIGVEAGSIPALSDAQQVVGYKGTKPEDLNKAPMFARPRVTLGLPRDFSLTIAGVPPVKAFGVTPRFFAVALGRPLITGDRINIGARFAAQVGSAQGAFTCPEEVVAFFPTSSKNPYGCREESEDVAHLRYVSGEVNLWRTLGRHNLTPHVTVALVHMNNVFNVDAQTRGFLNLFHDLTELRASGNVVSLSGGVGVPIGSRLSASVDLSYTPLGVMRDLGKNLSTTVTNEGLFNVKGLITYRVR